MRRFGKFIPLILVYKRIKKRFGKFAKVEKVGDKGKNKNPI